MLAIADDYLKEPDRKGASDTQSINSKTTTGSKMGSKIRENINSQGKHDPFKIKLLQDRLSDKEKSRLDSLLNDIDENLEDILKEKNEYYKKGSDTKSTISKASRITGVNVYNMTDEDSQ